MGEVLQGRLYGDADAYEAYMGSWSALLAPMFIAFAEIDGLQTLLDVGCGTGSLLVGARASFPLAKLVGIDPSLALLEKALARASLLGVDFVCGDAYRLPFEDATFDH